MGLEKVEIENFKSYKGRHVIGPLDKLTCIVGPNGAGKSNIMDAIAFALGVVSSSLRSRSLANLINAGSSQATVKLFIDNQTYTRHITSSGKSTYFLNGKLVSFEDYQNELTRIGLDLKLKNFMVFQGDIHEMANKTPKELCEYFEVLSGSIKFKKDYDAVASDLNRSLAECTMLFERRKNILSILKEEKEGEKQLSTFKSLIKEKSKLEKDILNLEFEDLTNKLETTKSNLEAIGKDRLKVNAKVKEVEETVLEHKQEVQKIKNELSSLEQDYQNLRLKRMNQVGQMGSYYKTKDRNNLRKNEIKVALEENEAKRKEILSLLDLEIKNLKRLKEGNESFMKAREENKNKVTKEQQEAYLEVTKEFRGDFERLKEEIDNKNKLLRDLKKQEAREEQKRKEKEKTQKKAQLLQANIVNLNKNVQEIKNKMGKEIEAYKALEEKEKHLNNQIEEVVGNLLRIRASKKISLKKETIRSVVHTLKGIFPGVHGLVKDLFKPVQKKFYSPLLNLIVSLDCAVVVDSDSTALACINYVKEKKLCKITFIPLDSLKQHTYNLFNESNFRSSILCVSFDEKFSKAIQWVFKDSLIADSKEVAYQLAYQGGLKSNIVTLDNLLIKSKGRLISTFEPQKEEDDLFSKLVEERKCLLREIKTVQDKKSGLSKIEIVKERLKVYESKIEQDEEEIKKLKEVENNFNFINLESERKSVFTELDNLNKTLRSFKGKFKEKEIEIVGNSFGPSTFEEFLESFKEDKLMEFENLKTKIENKMKFLEEKLTDLESQGVELENERVSVEVEVKGVDPELENELRRIDFLMDKKKVDLERELGTFNGLNERFKAIHGEEALLNSKYLELEALKIRLEDEIEGKRRMALLEEIEIEDTKAQDGETLESLRHQLDKINLRVNEIIPTIKTNKKEGNYDKIFKDYDEAKEKVVKIKNKMNGIKRERMECFMKCFERVSSEIGKIYQEISHNETNRGNAYLVMDNPIEPYLEGVRYHVMPPSKRFREIGYLSGGEKSMAILALMFAINVYRPVPFFILDEFDSALDKTNVSRMVDFFVRSNVQFLVISLKPLLFQFSDSLVGVYKEPNEMVSKILTYRL